MWEGGDVGGREARSSRKKEFDGRGRGGKQAFHPDEAWLSIGGRSHGRRGGKKNVSQM